MSQSIRLIGIPTVAGSLARFYSESEEILRAIAEDIDGARTNVLIEFYIWNEGGAADEVFEALIRTGRRGVSCRVLVNAVVRGPGGEGGNPSGSARRASVCSPHCPSACCKPSFRETIFACTARLS